MVKTDETYNETRPIRSTLSTLEVGDSAEFNARQYSSVRTTCTDYGFELGRKFSVSKDRESGSVKVTRTI